MAEESSKKSVLFQALLFLAVPALLYFTGYVYWHNYLDDFGLNMQEVQLPVYTIIFYSWHVFINMLWLFYLSYHLIKAADIQVDTATLPKSAIFVILSVISFILGNFFSAYAFPAILGPAFGIIAIALLYVAPWYHRRFPERKLTIHTRVEAPVSLFVIVVVLYGLAFIQGNADAAGILRHKWKKKPMVQFHFTSQQNPPLPDSLFLLISSDCYHFVLAPPDTPNGKPKIYAVNKDMLSHFEILPRDKQ